MISFSLRCIESCCYLMCDLELCIFFNLGFQFPLIGYWAEWKGKTQHLITVLQNNQIFSWYVLIFNWSFTMHTVDYRNEIRIENSSIFVSVELGLSGHKGCTNGIFSFVEVKISLKMYELYTSVHQFYFSKVSLCKRLTLEIQIESCATLYICIAEKGIRIKHSSWF